MSSRYSTWHKMVSGSKMQRVYRQCTNIFYSGVRIQYLIICLKSNIQAVNRVWDTFWSYFLSYAPKKKNTPVPYSIYSLSVILSYVTQKNQVGSMFDLQPLYGF